MGKRKRRRAKRPHAAKPDRGPAPRPAAARKGPEASPPADPLRPWLVAAMAALFVLAPLFASESVADQGDGLPLVMLWIALGVVWLLGVIGRPEFHVRFGWTDAAVVALLLWHSVAGIRAAWQATPRPAVNMTWEWIALGGSFLIARQLVSPGREARALLVVMVAVAAALGGYGLYQYSYELPQTRALYEHDPDAALREAGLWYEPGSPERELFEDRLDSTEPLATFALTNSLAGYLAPWLVVAAGIGVSGPPAGRGRWRLWIGVAIVAALVAACLLLTKSRSGFLAAVAGLVLAAWLCRPGRRRLGWKLPVAVVAGGAVLLAVAWGTGVLDRQVFTEASKSLGYRGQYWQSTVRMIADRPVFGCGPGNFRYAYTEYKLPEASEEIADPHNFLLEVWSTAGTPAALALLAVLGLFAWRIARARDEPTETSAAREPERPWFVLAGGAAGFVLSLPLGMMTAAPPGVAVLVLGLPLGAVAVWLLWPWVDRGRMPAALPAVGAVVLLVNLLAAGGIGFPGVAGTLWLLLAVGLNVAEPQPPQTLPRYAGLAAAVFTFALGVSCYTTAYGPVMVARGKVEAAQSYPNYASQYLMEAAEADPLDAQPWKQVGEMTFREWQEQPTVEMYLVFEKCADAASALEPNSAATHFQIGRWYDQIHDRTGRESDLKKAIAAYRRAVELYPTRSLYRARLALALKAAGDEAASREQADEALRLDGLTPHADKKLPDELRGELERK